MVDQQQIGEWHRRTFPDCDPGRLLAKLHEEVRELDFELGFLGYSDKAQLQDELADVAIVIMAIADRCGFNLQSATDNKFARVVDKYDGCS